MDQTTSDFLYSLYYKPSSPCAFSGVEKLYHEAVKLKPSLTYKQVQKWLKSQYTYTLHRQSVSKFKRNKIVVDREGRQWQCDLVDLKNFSRQNKGYAYLLNCVDVFSRRAIVEPLKDKTSTAVREAFENIFKHHEHPDFIQTDNGREFFGLKDLFGAYGIHHFFTTDHVTKCAIVERFNRTLRTKMFKLFTVRGTHVYWDVLQDLVDGYNSSYHRSIGVAPNTVNKKTRPQVFRRLYGCKDIYDYHVLLDRKNKRKKVSDVNVGDSVRIRHPKTTNAFMKMYYPQWRDRIFKVQKILKTGTQPIYKLDTDNTVGISANKRRGLYRQEIQPVEPDTYRVDRIIKRDPVNKRVLVSWLDYPSSHNSWIPESEIDRVKQLVNLK